jgi:hypothetical protein
MPGWTDGEDTRMADYRGEGPDDNEPAQAPCESQQGWSEDSSTDELRREAAYWCWFQDDADAARADTDDRERDSDD